MKRNIAAMADKKFDVLIIGGGITGISIARDASLRGLSVALVEKSDFASATTSASSKLIHGGLRYLQNLELGLVRESLRERRVWSNIAPHMVRPLMFLMPLYDKGIRGRLKMALGLTAYDLLAYDRNRLDDPENAIPAHRTLNREEALRLEPGLESPKLSGATIFYDYQMHYPERLALACLRSAVAAGAEVANYVELREFLMSEGQVIGARLRDNLINRPDFVVTAKVTVNAAGPWADILMDTYTGKKGGRRLIRSKGIHILTRSLSQGHALAAQTPRGHFFILPWRGYSLIGTTDTVYRGDPDAFRVTEKDIADFITAINEAYPAAKLKRSDILHFYGGLRPIVDQTSTIPDTEDSRDSYSASRAAEIVDHESDAGPKGIITAIGGKWTTARHLAEQVVDMIQVKLGDRSAPCLTAETPVYGGDTGVYADFLESAKLRYAENLAPDSIEFLCANYGTAMAEILRLAEQNRDLYARLDESLPNIAAEIPYAVNSEMAQRLDDVLIRRTGMGSVGKPKVEIVDRVCGMMADILEWTPEEVQAEKEHLLMRYTPSARVRAIVNPRSSSGKTMNRWPEFARKLADRLGPFDTAFTDAPMDALRLTASALKDGVEHIIAVGGDGTINEVINGFFQNDRPINPQAVLSIITSGTGGDFRRTFNSSLDIEQQVERVVESEARTIDLGRLTYRDDATGDVRTRYFDNVASFGLSGAADRAVNQLTFGKKMGGKIAFQWGTLSALLHYKGQRVHLQVDDHYDEVLDINTVAVCNGCYFGSGMKIAPEAKPDDGIFDIIVIRKASLFQIVKGFPAVYFGRHLNNTKHVFMLRGRRVIAEPCKKSDEVLLDVDGEAPGRLPATFEVVPRAILLKY